jgi:hypothetical protein
LVDQIQKLTERYPNYQLRAFVVYAGGSELKPAIEQVTQKYKITIPVTYLPEGKTDPALRQYKINPEAKNTLVTYRDKTVTANFVNVDATTFPKVAAAAAAMLNAWRDALMRKGRTA